MHILPQSLLYHTQNHAMLDTLMALNCIMKPSGAFHEAFFHRNSNSRQTSFCSHLRYTTLVAIKFCTWHDSCAVVACAKCSDMIPYNGVTLKQICHRIWIRMDKILHEMGPWAENNHRSGKNYGWNVVVMETHYFIIYYLNTFIRRKGMWLSQKQVYHNTGNIIFTAFIPK